MPIHDWTRVDAGLFHDFHQSWTVALSDALNLGFLPPNYYALLEQRILGPKPEVLSAQQSSGDTEIYAAKADCIAVRRQNGGVVAVIEIVSPGNKTSRAELRGFVKQMSHLIHQNVNLLVIDLFPPGPFDPLGMHKAIWDEFYEGSFDWPDSKPLFLSAYNAGSPCEAYIDPVAVGDLLPDMPLFLATDSYIPAPLESTYQKAWSVFPAVLKRLLEEPPKS